MDGVYLCIHGGCFFTFVDFDFTCSPVRRTRPTPENAEPAAFCADFMVRVKVVLLKGTEGCAVKRYGRYKLPRYLYIHIHHLFHNNHTSIFSTLLYSPLFSLNIYFFIHLSIHLSSTT